MEDYKDVRKKIKEYVDDAETYFDTAFETIKTKIKSVDVDFTDKLGIGDVDTYLDTFETNFRDFVTKIRKTVTRDDDTD